MDFNCNIPCIVCPPSIGGGVGPVDPANPFNNLSSEDPDSDDFIGRRYTLGRPPLGSNWHSIGCIGWCLSSVSQEEADLCAAVQNAICTSPEWPQQCLTCPTTVNDPFPEQPATIYYNFAQSCAFECPDGSFYNFTVASGIFASVVNQATVDLMAYSYACNKAVLNHMCVGELAPVRSCSNAFYSGVIVATTTNVPVGYTELTALPDGLLLSQNDTGSAFITGTPTTPGDYVFSLRATDSVGQSIEKVFNLSIFGVATIALADGAISTPYSDTLQYSGTPSGTVVWAVAAGTLPDGLSLNPATGEISGTPTTEETQTLSISVTDGTMTCFKSLGIQVAASQDCPDWSTLLWGVPAYFEVGTGAASFTPDSAAGNIFLMGLVAAPINPNQAEVVQTATIPYNGTGCQIQLTLDIQNVGGAIGAGTVQVVSDIAGALYNGAWAVLGTGVHVEGFFIPDTGGMPSVITIQVTGQKIWNATPGTMQVQGTFENFI